MRSAGYSFNCPIFLDGGKQVSIIADNKCLLPGSTVANPEVTLDFTGGAMFIMLDTASLVLQGLTLQNGVAPAPRDCGGSSGDNSGGVISARNGNALTVRDCRFLNCDARASGGAIYVGSLHATDTTFVDNGATTSGGSIAVSGNAIIHNCTFTRSTVSGYGGALSVAGYANISDTSFINCSTSGPGGAVNLGSATLTNCDFAGCHTEDDCQGEDDCHGPAGGAISADVLTLEGCKFVLPKDQSVGHNDISAPSVTFACPPGTKGSSRNVPGPLEPNQLPPSTEIVHCTN
jgi:predicted outer membrane repeat protein